MHWNLVTRLNNKGYFFKIKYKIGRKDCDEMRMLNLWKKMCLVGVNLRWYCCKKWIAIYLHFLKKRKCHLFKCPNFNNFLLSWGLNFKKVTLFKTLRPLATTCTLVLIFWVHSCGELFIFQPNVLIIASSVVNYSSARLPYIFLRFDDVLDFSNVGTTRPST